MSSSKLFYKIKTLALVSSSSSLLLGGYCYYKNDEKFFNNFLMPTIRLLDAEKAHELAVKVCKFKAVPAVDFTDPESLVTLPFHPKVAQM